MSIKSEEAARAAKRAYAVALAKAQLEISPISADMSNPQTESKYASHAALDRVLRPIYLRHGFSLSFNTGDSPQPDHVRVLCDVTYADDVHVFEKQHHIDIPADGKGAQGIDVMTKTHAAVSAVSIGIRALLRMIFNIVIERREDDDGNAAGRRPPATAPGYTPPPGSLSPDQVAEIRTQIRNRVVRPEAFLAWAEVPRIEEIPDHLFESCLAALNNFKLRATA